MRSSGADRHVLGLAAAAFLALAPLPAPAVAAETVSVVARPISQFRIGRDETRFGPFEFVGGLELIAGRPFGGLSGFRFRTAGSAFAGVTDTGYWYFGTIVRDAQGRPAGWEDVTMTPMVDGSGRRNNSSKVETDAEGMAIVGDRAIVSFEREHKVLEFRLDPPAMGRPLRSLDFLVPMRELRRNRGFETVIATPRDGPHGGAIIVIAEKSIDRAGNVFGAVLSGPRKGIFTVARTDEYDITDGAMLPDGDVLILERRFALPAGVSMRLRRLEADTIGKGLVADGPVLMEANMAYQIDNMEGLEVWRRADGTTIVSLVSDDNTSFLQRNLYLEFEMKE